MTQADLSVIVGGRCVMGLGRLCRFAEALSIIAAEMFTISAGGRSFRLVSAVRGNMSLPLHYSLDRAAAAAAGTSPIHLMVLVARYLPRAAERPSHFASISTGGSWRDISFRRGAEWTGYRNDRADFISASDGIALSS